MFSRAAHRACATLVATASVIAVVQPATAQTIDPFYAGDYTLESLGAVPGVIPNYGGVTFKYDDPNTLLIGGSANSIIAKIYSIGVTRGCLGQITGFVGTAQIFAETPHIDGG